MPEHGRPRTFLRSRFIFAANGPWWHRNGNHLKWLVRTIDAELKRCPKGNCQRDARPQINYRRLLTVLLPPHPTGATSDVPDLLDGGMGHSSRDFTWLKLEVSEAAMAANMAQRPNRRSVRCDGCRSVF